MIRTLTGCSTEEYSNSTVSRAKGKRSLTLSERNIIRSLISNSSREIRRANRLRSKPKDLARWLGISTNREIRRRDERLINT